MNRSKKRVWIQTFGCQMNVYEVKIDLIQRRLQSRMSL